ncbi:LysE family translocator [Microvirga zambiensis]|uniref:LysE family translocator n=1 Tax=Microvirga zambiensis TaxID=1402137 RepID=UPI00191D8CD9|nr:LysE family translocator [Microvirga zambiensis]
MMDFGNIWFFIVPFALAAALPGPAQGALVAQVLTRGGAASAPFLIGMVAGNALWLLAAIFGLSTLALRFEGAFIAVKWLGVAYLLFLAWKLWNAPSSGAEPEPPASGNRGILAGAAITVGNPKAVVFFGAVLPHAFDMTALSMTEIGVILALGVGIDLAVQTIYLSVAARARSFIRSSRQIRIVNRSAAGLMAGSAAVIASRG